MKQILILMLTSVLMASSCTKTPTPPPPTPADTQKPTQPGKPGGSTTSTEVNANWSSSTDNVAVAGYDVFLNGAKIPQPVTITNVTIAGLAPNTDYIVTVQAFDKAGNKSDISDATTFRTQPPAPVPPIVTTGSATINSNTSITFAGNIPNDGGAAITNHIMVIKWTNVDGTPGKDSILNVAGNGSFSYTKTNCIPGVTYSYKAAAVNSAGYGEGTFQNKQATGFTTLLKGWGGQVIYTWSNSDSAIIADTLDVWEFIQWGCPGTNISTSASFGASKQNTINIVSGCAETNTAAKYADTSTRHGYTDWYLGNVDLYQKTKASGMPWGTYGLVGGWTSEQVNAFDAKLFRMSDGVVLPAAKQSGGSLIREHIILFRTVGK